MYIIPLYYNRNFNYQILLFRHNFFYIISYINIINTKLIKKIIILQE